MSLVIATLNQGKFVELRSGLEKVGFQVHSLQNFPDVPEAPETGESFSQIAQNKAQFYFDRLQIPVLAEDSGLLIEALGGYPGILSARIGNSDQERINLVLEKLRFSKTRAAYYHCSMVYISAESKHETTGRCDGTITESPRGQMGFGYDPIFVPENSERTFGEMSIEEKQPLSHRGRALQKMIPLIHP